MEPGTCRASWKAHNNRCCQQHFIMWSHLTISTERLDSVPLPCQLPLPGNAVARGFLLTDNQSPFILVILPSIWSFSGVTGSLLWSSLLPGLATKTILPTQFIHREETLILRLGGAPRIVPFPKGFGVGEQAIHCLHLYDPVHQRCNESPLCGVSCSVLFETGSKGN